MERVIQQIVFRDCDANVIRSGNHVGGSADFFHLKERAFFVVAFSRFPWTSSEEVRIVERHIVVAPVSRVLDRAGTRDSRLEAGGLGDEPVRHVTTVAVAANREMIWIRDSIL